jgi:alkylhydroperoxidase family enzyme
VGITDEQIRALTFYQRSAAFDAKDKATVLFADRLTRGAAAVREATLEELRKHFSEEQIVELTLVVCMANFTNRFNDGLQVEPDIG